MARTGEFTLMALGTVNIASRMESGGFALRVHLSETTAEVGFSSFRLLISRSR
jgi:hypothetical protein